MPSVWTAKESLAGERGSIGTLVESQGDANVIRDEILDNLKKRFAMKSELERRAQIALSAGIIDQEKADLYKRVPDEDLIRLLERKDLIVVRAHNVNELLSTPETAPFKNLLSLPNIMPPWPLVWVETPPCMGWLFMTRLFSPDERKALHSILGDSLLALLAGCQLATPVPYLLLDYVLLVGSDGRMFAGPISLSLRDKLVNSGFEFFSTFKWINADNTAEILLVRSETSRPDLLPHDAMGRFWSCALPLLTFSLSNCKNVSAIKHVIPEALRKKRARTGKPAVDRYYTLMIDPMREILKTEGQSQTSGVLRAMHICRGHFAEYTQGKGLFGKYHGSFWRPEHKRGSSKVGAIMKDYEIESPTSDDEDK